MKTIENLLQEYRIRFRDTEKIKEEGYPFSIHKGIHIHGFNQGSMTEVIGKDVIINKNGKIYEDGIWATADLKEKPIGWVVDLDKEHPKYNYFIKWYKDKAETSKRYMFNGRYQSSHSQSDCIFDFKSGQLITLDQWADFFLPKVDFSILNDEDWFYVKTIEEREWVGKGNIIERNTDKCIHYCITSGRVYYNTRKLINEGDILLLRKATPEDLAPMFEKYPELAPPKIGDWGIFYDHNRVFEKEDVVKFLAVLGCIDDNGYHKHGYNMGWDNFYKIDPDKPLRPQIDEFLKQQTK